METNRKLAVDTIDVTQHLDKVLGLNKTMSTKLPSKLCDCVRQTEEYNKIVGLVYPIYGTAEKLVGQGIINTA